MVKEVAQKNDLAGWNYNCNRFKAIVKKVKKRCCRSKSMDLKRGIDKAVEAID
jgi:hypothetical protein